MAEGTETIEQPAEVIEAPETEAPASAEGADELASFDDATKKRISEIVSKRINSVNSKWEKFGKPEEIEARLTRAQQLEQWAANFRESQNRNQTPGSQVKQDAQFTEEDKKVQAYLERIAPGITKFAETEKQRASQLKAFDDFRWSQITQTNTNYLKDMVTKSGYTEDQFNGIHEVIANSIRGNQQDLVKYLTTGDQEVVKRHFDIVDKWLKGISPKPPLAAAPAVSAAKAGAKTNSLPPRMPAAGVPAQTSKKEKMNTDQRVAAAFERFKNS